MGTMIRLTARDGHRLDAYLADAESLVKGGVVVLQEAFGVNRHICDVCDDYARCGFCALAGGEARPVDARHLIHLLIHLGLTDSHLLGEGARPHAIVLILF